ncbi:DUF4244 domain-containing protein [Streptomyces sp. LD120]|uniref:DUF4244 domain-containing protein n=1 Tax=Streptomyces physcomitrii TaxID=2724184 RepID=A0ABX1GZQ3_9ACTN|nr:DUF4244 domain-containing protein [Streptomyces physcomitrii]
MGVEMYRAMYGARRTGVRVRAVRARARCRDAGMVTSEYAMGLIAAVGFAGLLYKVITSAATRKALQDIVEKALHAL